MRGLPPPVTAPAAPTPLLQPPVELPVVELPAGGVELDRHPSWLTHAKHILGPVAAIVLFAVALLTLNHLLRQNSLDDVLAELKLVPPLRIVGACALSVLAYAALSLYDYLGLAYAQKVVSHATIAVTSFVAYAFSHNIGFNVVTGSAIRARMYGRAGLSAVDVAKVVSIQSTALWLGAFAIVGTILVVMPDDLSPVIPIPSLAARALGVALFAAIVGWITLCFRARRTFHIGPLVLQLPSGRLAILQLGVSCLDWLLLSSILWALLPAHTAPYSLVVAAVVTSTFVALISHVPGGLGVFESLAGAILADWIEPPALLSALLLLRVIYYIVPFVFALVVFGATEAWARRKR